MYSPVVQRYSSFVGLLPYKWRQRNLIVFVFIQANARHAFSTRISSLVEIKNCSASKQARMTNNKRVDWLYATVWDTWGPTHHSYLSSSTTHSCRLMYQCCFICNKAGISSCTASYSARLDKIFQWSELTCRNIVGIFFCSSRLQYSPAQKKVSSHGRPNNSCLFWITKCGIRIMPVHCCDESSSIGDVTRWRQSGPQTSRQTRFVNQTGGGDCLVWDIREPMET